ncbi:MAG TPA: RluA family pseudouridine synthase [Vicinamibacterales bacterium]|nr:RluA family pseudouridine synthase [Vicinamibacterales bacterium]
MRLDQRLRDLRPDLSWSRIRTAIERGQVTVDDIVTRDPGEEVSPSNAVSFDPERRALRTVRLDLPRLYEDEEILVVDKPAGLLTVPTHPEARATEDTVLRRAQEYARRVHGRSGYAGMLHRLDRDTSGALAIALSRDAHRLGRELFAAHEFNRWYLAIVHGVPDERAGTIDAPISNDYVSGRRRIARAESRGRHAVTHYRVRDAYRNAALLELRLETGRQHQIRLHLQELGHPLVGERVYRDDAGRARAARQMLHAWKLEFRHPTRPAVVAAEAPVPPDMARLCALLARQAQ